MYVIKKELKNEYGSEYGWHYLVFASNPQEAHDWIEKELEKDGCPYWTGRSVFEQIKVTIVSRFDGNGNINRENSPWFDLLGEFARKNIGPSILKKIYSLSQ